MKFYFCEGCGRRITEQDIDAGQGKDKKLKGVYCGACAVGVLTMETLPLSAEEAQAVLKGEPGAVPSVPSGKNQRRTTSAIGIPLSRQPLPRRASPAQEAKKTNSLPTKPTRLAVRAGLALLAMGLLSAAVWAGFGGKAPKEERPTVGSTVPTRVSTGRPLALKPPPAAPSSEAERRASPQIPPVGGQVRPGADASVEAYQKLLKFEGLAPDDRVGRVQRIEAFLKGHGQTAEAAGARQLLAELERADPTRPEGQEVVPARREQGGVADGPSPAQPERDQAQAALNLTQSGSPQAPARETAAPVARPAPHEAAFDVHFDALRGALGRSDLAQARASAERMAQDAALGVWRTPANRLAGAVRFLAEQERRREETWRNLEGKEVTLETVKGPRRGIVVAVEKDSLQVQARFQINGKWKDGNLAGVPRSELKPETLARLLPGWEPSGVEEWAARVLEQLSGAGLEAGERSLQHLGEDPAAILLRRGLDRMKRQREEERAAEAWSRLKAKAEGSLSEEDGERLLGELSEVEQRFGKTEFVFQKASERAATREHLEKVARIAEKRLQRAFKGRVTLLDVKAQRLTVEYDFQKERAQLADWGGERPPFATFTKEGRLLVGRPQQEGRCQGNLLNQAFEVGELILEVDYEFRNGGGNALIWFGLPGEGRVDSGESGLLRFGPNGSSVASGAYGHGGASNSLARSAKKPPQRGTVKLTLTQGQFKAEFDGQTHLDCKFPGAGPGSAGLSFGLESFMVYLVDRIRITGRVNQAWLKRAMAAAESAGLESVGAGAKP